MVLEIDLRALPIDPSDRHAWLEAIMTSIRQAIAEYHGIVLSAVALVTPGAVAKTSSGKLRRGACRAAFIDESLNMLARWPVDARVGDRRMVAEGSRNNRRPALVNSFASGDPS
jgi:hypothetical protein